MTEQLYVTRRNIFSRHDRTYSLGADAVHWWEGSKSGHVPYADIDRVQVYASSSYTSAHAHCILRDRRKKKTRIQSFRFKGLGRFENQPETYVPFVEELCRRVAAANPRARFLAGSTLMWCLYVALLLMVAVGVLMLMTAPMIGDEHLMRMAVSLMPIVVLLIRGRSVLRRGNTREFDPGERIGELQDLYDLSLSRSDSRGQDASFGPTARGERKDGAIAENPGPIR